MFSLLYDWFGFFRSTVLGSLFARLCILLYYRAIIGLGVMEFHALLKYFSLLSILREALGSMEV